MCFHCAPTNKCPLLFLSLLRTRSFIPHVSSQMKLEGESLPLAVRDSEERLSKGGVYLLETGLHLFLWVGANAQQELLLNIFGTPSFGQIDSSLVSEGDRKSVLLTC